MLAEKTKRKLLIGLIVLVVALTVVLIALHALRGRDKRAALPPVTPRPSAEVVIREKEVEKIITVEKEITADTVQESLRDAGILITEEYYFTEVVNYSSIKKLWKLDLGITESSYLAGYDGDGEADPRHAARRRDPKRRHRPGELCAVLRKGGAGQPPERRGFQQLPD